jgi:hypothetical protein
LARRIALVLLTIAVGWLFWYLLVAAIGLAAALPVWKPWFAVFPTRRSAVLTWMVTWHTLAIVLVSLPFGFLIHRMWGRWAPLIALAITLAMFALELPDMGQLFRGQPLRFQLVAVFDQLKLIGVLPLVAWLASRLPSNNRWRGP